MNKRISVLTIGLVLLLTFLPAIPAHASQVNSNAGFESGTGADADNWTEGTNHERSSEQAHAGTYSLKSSYTGASTTTTSGSLGDYGYNTTFYVSFWAYRDSSVGDAFLRVRASSAGGANSDFHTTTSTGYWQLVTGTTASFSTAWYMYVDLITENMGGNVFFDDVCVGTVPGDCITVTPTPTNTATPTRTPSPTATHTPTPTIWATSSYSSIIWADNEPVTLSSAMEGAIEILLHATPPAGSVSNIYAATFISGVDSAWNISLDNLTGVESPYTDWNTIDNAVITFSVTCSGTEPSWTCEYYEPPSGGGGSSLRFPWKTGYAAWYGVSGVHSGSGVIPGSFAVDFVGEDSDTSSMPPYAVAASDGHITWVCGDSIGMAIKVEGGPVPLAYYHFAPGQSFTIGQTVRQGEVLGSLIYGSFTGTSACQEYGTQKSDQYHLHFVFLPTSTGYLQIGGCVLDLGTQKFVCNGNTYAIGSKIPNGGTASNPSSPSDPGGSSASGGAHIWDGIVSAIVELGANSITQYLPEQAPIVGYVLSKTALLVQFVLSFVLMVQSMGFSGYYFGAILVIAISLSLGLWAVEIAMQAVSGITSLAKFFL